MKKVLDFLEKNVQWIAIALGGVYLLWMVYSYVLMSPVTVSDIAADPLPPGKVDETIRNEAADKLERMIQVDKPVVFATPDFSKLLTNITSAKPMQELPAVAYNSPTAPVVPSATGTTIKGAGAVLAQIGAVTQLPKLPAAIDLQEANGRSNVIIPPAVIAGPGQPPPVQPAPVAPGQQATGTDIGWATVMYKIPVAEIAKEFTACKIPPFAKTSVIQVELIRQERESSGNWGPETTVPTLTTVALLPWPAGNQKNQLRNYADFASQHWGEIMQPAFYTIVKGDGWHLPGEAALANPSQPQDPNAKPLDPNGVRPAFDPANPPRDMTPAEMKRVQEYRKQKAREEAERRRANQPSRGGPRGGPEEGLGGPGGRPGRGGGGPGGFAPNDPQRPQLPPDFRPPGMFDPASAGEGGIGEGFQPQQPQMNPNVQGVFPLPPPGELDPRLWIDPKDPGAIGSLVGWAHDATAQPGKTYRYKVRYKMKNPIFAMQNVAKDAALVQEFALVSPDSAWSADVHIPALTSFFVAAVNFGQSARIDVYRWQAGETHAHTFTVVPGDVIGGMDKGIDFGTGYTLVDLRKDPRTLDDYVVLVDSSGNVIQRTPKDDQANPDLQRMKQQVSMTSNSNAVAGSGPGR